MKKEIENKLIDCIGIENVKLEEPMEKHTTFRIGGPADYFLCPQTAEELKYMSVRRQGHRILFWEMEAISLSVIKVTAGQSFRFGKI